MEIITNLTFSHDYWVILFPCILMLLDIISGYYYAWKSKTISSSKMRDGLGKKVAELIYIVVGILISIVFKIKMVGYFISFYIIYMEIVSLIENCRKLGVNAPKQVQDKIDNIKGDENND